MEEPAYFRDLNLDRVETDVFGAGDEYDVVPHFRCPLDDQALIQLRQAVFADLDRADVRAAVDDFVRRMRVVRERLHTARRASEPYEGQRWHLEAAVQYCDAVLTLRTELSDAEPASSGLQGIVAHLDAYHDSAAFRTLRHDRSAAVGALSSVHYGIWIDGARVTVGSYDDEPDYTEELEQTFARFRAVDVDSTQLSVPRGSGPLDHVEASVLACTAKIFPAHFEVLDRFCRDHHTFLDPVTVLFDREIHFYLSYLDYLAPLEENGLHVTTPVLAEDAVSESLVDVYDLPLAVQCVAQDRQVVVNTVTLDAPERILVISGPNNGGKTTLARTIGQLHHLARIGCPVPGREVRILACDAMYTHFERQEDLTTLAGRLQSELIALHATVSTATSRSLIVMNEMFSSTTVTDAQYLSQKILERITALGAIGVCVTFLDELATMNQATVSMVSTVDPHDARRRTFQVLRKPADGHAYAHALAEKYGLTRDEIRVRMRA
ncbi:hypothetical protein [Allobranchiibius sp. GilTou73]|uniref:MutS-related protein n=1 Tax=Allobranchiibius sp. GilTou73 TaxID=2904523 RepID=UPI001F3BA23A|nr:hypothetical protein [Allobranchiibius sp. GilTou73]UIJ33734.1 hypothetical protein LVQ62_11265 [Allobranchiibius sp. GilTou73]